MCSYTNVLNQRVRKNASLNEILVMIFKTEVFEKLRPKLLEEFYKETDYLRKLLTQKHNDSVKHYSNHINDNNEMKDTKEMKDIKTLLENYDYNILKYFIDFLTSVHVTAIDDYFTNELEKRLIEQSIANHKKIFDMILINSTNSHNNNINTNNFDLLEYLEEGLLLIKEEEQLTERFLPIKTVNILKNELIKAIFFDNSSKIIDTKFEAELNSKSGKSLSLLFSIFKEDKKNSIFAMNIIFKKHVKSEFSKLIAKLFSGFDFCESLGYESNYVMVFYEFYKYYFDLVGSAFQGENIFKVSLHDILEHVQLVDERFNNSYLFSYYLDKCLSISRNKDNKENKVENTKTNSIMDVENSNTNDNYNISSSTNQDQNTTFSNILKVVELFNTIPDKDIFIDTYKKLLSKRLLNEDTISIELEKKALEEFKKIGGINFTSSLFIMISDYEDSRAFSDEINSNIINKQSTLIRECYFKRNDIYNNTVDKKQFEIKLLDKDKWPLLSDYRTSFPEPIQKLYSEINEYYKSKKPNSHLEFDMENTQVEMEFKSRSKRDNDSTYTLLLNGTQALVLCFFNTLKKDGYSIHLSSLEKKINLDKSQFYTAIKNFLKLEILSKDKEDNLTLNLNFYNENKSILVNEKIKEAEIKSQKVEVDRSYAVDAAIVRILKRNKNKIIHNDLIQKLKLEALLFNIESISLKDKIESLIERGLIERSSENVDEYIYV